MANIQRPSNLSPSNSATGSEPTLPGTANKEGPPRRSTAPPCWLEPVIIRVSLLYFRLRCPVRAATRDRGGSEVQQRCWATWVPSRVAGPSSLYIFSLLCSCKSSEHQLDAFVYILPSWPRVCVTFYRWSPVSSRKHTSRVALETTILFYFAAHCPVIIRNTLALQFPDRTSSSPSATTHLGSDS